MTSSRVAHRLKQNQYSIMLVLLIHLCGIIHLHQSVQHWGTMMRTKEQEVRSDKTTDNQTWNDCPRCRKTWKDEIPTPGLIHRTRLCEECRNENESLSSRHYSR